MSLEETLTIEERIARLTELVRVLLDGALSTSVDKRAEGKKKKSPAKVPDRPPASEYDRALRQVQRDFFCMRLHEQESDPWMRRRRA